MVESLSGGNENRAIERLKAISKKLIEGLEENADKTSTDTTTNNRAIDDIKSNCKLIRENWRSIRRDSQERKKIREERRVQMEMERKSTQVPRDGTITPKEDRS